MKRLMLMRHAKSSWRDESITDFERPLNDRGKRDALTIGRELSTRGAIPEIIVSSKAVRALDTTRLVCEGLAVETWTGAGISKANGASGVLPGLVHL